MSFDKSANHQWNKESAIFFLQNEHSNTLKALHLEIESLQKKCTDLTFQLTMHGYIQDEQGKTDSFLSQVSHEQSRANIQMLEKELDDKEKKIHQLENELKNHRKRWLDDNRLQLQSTHLLRAELEAKSNNIAYLTSELNKLKQKLKNDHCEPPAFGSSTHANLSYGGHTHFDAQSHITKKTLHPHHIPVPPSKEKTLPPGAARLRRPNKNNGNMGKVVLALNTVNSDSIKQPNQILVSPGRSSGSDSPDISPFLPLSSQEIPIIGAKSQPVLPPIPVSAAAMSGVLMHHMVPSAPHYPQKKPSLTSNTELVSLAVENAGSSESSWKLAESHSSEYN